MSEDNIEEVRKRIWDKLTKQTTDKDGKPLSGTFSTAGLFTPIEEAVYRNDMFKQAALLDAHMCPNCKVSMQRKSGWLPFNRTLECPKCGFTASGM